MVPYRAEYPHGKPSKCSEEGEQQSKPIGRGLGVFRMEHIAATQRDSVVLVCKLTDEIYLGEDGCLVVILTTTGGLVRKVPVRAVHKVHPVMM